MADPEQLKILRQGIPTWNTWGKENRRVFVNLRFKPGARINAEFSSFFNKHKAQITAPIVPDGLPWVARLPHKETRSDHHLILRVGRFLSQNAQLNVRLFKSSLQHESYQRQQG